MAATKDIALTAATLDPILIHTYQILVAIAGMRFHGAFAARFRRLDATFVPGTLHVFLLRAFVFGTILIVLILSANGKCRIEIRIDGTGFLLPFATDAGIVAPTIVGHVRFIRFDALVRFVGIIGFLGCASLGIRAVARVALRTHIIRIGHTVGTGHVEVFAVGAGLR